MSHTEEKLTARGDLVCDSSGEPFWDYYNKSQAENEANARRLAACWNYCSLISTENLESRTGILLSRTINPLLKEIDTLKAENAELMKAAKEFIDYFNPGADVDLSLGQMMAFLQQYENKLRTTLDNAKTPR